MCHDMHYWNAFDPTKYTKNVDPNVHMTWLAHEGSSITSINVDPKSKISK